MRKTCPFHDRKLHEKYFYDVVKSASVDEAASFLETNVHSVSSSLFSASPVFASSCV